MLSTCPSCLNQVNHEDHLLEVQCECGTHFNPFVVAQDSADHSQSDPAQVNSDFSESSSVFEELRNYGESLGQQGAEPEVSSSSQTRPDSEPQVEAPTETAFTEAGTEQSSNVLPMISGFAFEGYRIEEYLSPVSVRSEADWKNESPLQPAFLALSTQALRGGANGVAGIQWVVLPDGVHCVLSGTAVRLTKLQGT